MSEITTSANNGQSRQSPACNRGVASSEDPILSSTSTVETDHSPPNSPSRPVRLASDGAATSIPRHPLRSRASSTYFEDLLSEYVALKCKDKSTRKDFDEATMESLRQLPLFQAIQVVHRFNDSVGPRVVNRSAFLVSVIRSTSRWWSTSSSSQSGGSGGGGPKAPFSKEISLLEDGPNTHFAVQLCMNGVLNPDVFTPSVCHALQLLTPEQILSVAQNFGSSSVALHVADDSYYAKQQLFLSMAHAALMNFPSKFSSTSQTTAHSTSGAGSGSDHLHPHLHHHQHEDSQALSEATASEAAEIGRRRADEAAAAQLQGILTEYLARTLSNQKIRESEIDATARDALKRVSLIQAMQALQHFSVSLDSDQIQKKSAYLMGVLRGQEQHWERSRASRMCPGGEQELLALHPRLVLKIAHLCLDGNLLPSDFSPEVCYELKDLDCDTAIRFVMAFNANKRICAGEHGGIKNRVGFFLGLLRNLKMNEIVNSTSGNSGAIALNSHSAHHPQQQQPHVASSSPSAFTTTIDTQQAQQQQDVGPGSKPPSLATPTTSMRTHPSQQGVHFESELNAAAKPFTPMSSMIEPPTSISSGGKSVASGSPAAGPTSSMTPSGAPPSSSSSSSGGGDGGLRQPSSAIKTPVAPLQQQNFAVERSSPMFETLATPSSAPTSSFQTFSPVTKDQQAAAPPPSGLAQSIPLPSMALPVPALVASQPNTAAVLSTTAQQPVSQQSQQQVEALEKRVKELSRLLDSSRDAISFLTSSLARSRTSELRLRRELQESEARVHSLMQAFHMHQDFVKAQVETVRNQALVSMQRSFDSLVQNVDQHGMRLTTPVAGANSSHSGASETGGATTE